MAFNKSYGSIEALCAVHYDEFVWQSRGKTVRWDDDDDYHEKKWDSEKIGKESWENFIVIEKIKLAKIRVKTINEKVIRFRIH